MKITNKMRLADFISRHKRLGAHTVHSAVNCYCVTGDRRLRELAREFMLRKNRRAYPSPRNGEYHFNKKFQDFCGVWYRQQLKKISKKGY